MMSSSTPTQFGSLPSVYDLFLNPSMQRRYTRCPRCRDVTSLKRFGFVLFLEGRGLVTVGATSRICSKCKLVILHQDVVEQSLGPVFPEGFEFFGPEERRQYYTPIGTLHRRAWNKVKKGDTITYLDLQHNTADFRDYVFFPQTSRTSLLLGFDSA